MSPDGRNPEEAAAEIDRLRLEAQRLRIELSEAKAREASLEHTLRRGARQIVDRASATVRGIARRVRGGHVPANTAALPPPYVVKPVPVSGTARPRVLHVIMNFYLGGSARLVVDLLEGLGHAYDQRVVSCDLPPAPAYTGFALTHHTAFTLDAALDVLRRERPDLLHVHYLGHHGDKYGARDWEWYRHWFAAAERLGIRAIENINIPTEPFVSDAVACYAHVSDYVREVFGRRDGRHVTIYPGSDLAMFAPAPGAQPADDVLGMVYRLGRDKLNEQSIDPFIEAIRRRPGTRALIVGGGVLLDAHKGRVAAAGLEDAFTFTGYAAYETLPALYAQMSVFVAPVHTESFGQVTPFAMGMKLPVIGYDVGAIPEIVGDTSLIAPSGDSARLGAIAAALLDDRPRRLALGEANRARAERLFSVEAMVAAYEALYRKLAPTAAHRPAP
ncbi:MAG: glycosyltransferase [Gemmatimonadetes bacterium]|nr:glycosyltransferase [Gemmatimonadota bacterium]